MEKNAWYYFTAEDRHYTAEYYFQANSKEEAEAKARILYGDHEPLYGERLTLIDEKIDFNHAYVVNRLTECGEDDFDRYLKRHKEKITHMIEILQSRL